MVGALARFNVNYDQLHPKAKSAAAALGLQAQVRQPVHEHGRPGGRDRPLRRGRHPACATCCSPAASRWEEPVQPARLSGEGAGACDVPRGTLFHNYVIAGRAGERRQLHHPHRPEPEQHRSRHARPGAHHPRPAAGGDHALARDARAGLRPVHLVLDAHAAMSSSSETALDVETPRRSGRTSGQAAPTLVLALGNPLRGDDGAGPAVLERLAAARIPAGVELIDGGLAGLETALHLQHRRRAIILDAADFGATPGHLATRRRWMTLKLEVAGEGPRSARRRSAGSPCCWARLWASSRRRSSCT